MSEECDIAVVGAGAAGLAAAIFAAETSRSSGSPCRIAVLDGACPVGAKILISGGGRCNVTHARVTPADYAGARPVVRNVLSAFDADRARRWFEGLGVRLKVEPSGKVFPVSDRARTILAVLLERCRALGVELLEDHRVHRVVPDDDGFALGHGRGELRARHVILATGGRSLPRTGSDGSGWQLAADLGHTVTDTYPALVPLVLAGDFFHAGLSGVSHAAELATIVQGKVVDRRAGSLLWTHFGVSGPVVLDASRYWLAAERAGRRPELRCSFCPGRDEATLDQWLRSRSASAGTLSVTRVLGDLLPTRLADALCRYVGISAGTCMASLTREHRRSLAVALVGLPLPVVGHRGWDYAEATAGGVPLAEVDYRTMGSRRAKGLFLAGEMLDCDGRVGGFNFHWAWATGYLAGTAAARSAARSASRSTARSTARPTDGYLERDAAERPAAGR